MMILARGGLAARLASDDADLKAAQRLRYSGFVAGRGAAAQGARAAGLDADRLDRICAHMLVEDRATGALICCFRMLPLRSGAEIGRSYSAQFYDLAGLRAYPAPMIEIGRFCVHEAWRREPGVIRLAWMALAAHVEARGAGMLFGCSSFEGIDAGAYTDAFALLKARHLAPARWRPRAKAPKIFPFARRLRSRRPEMRRALMTMPPLLRAYLAMGGWVSDHAVVDEDLGTLHVFTGLEAARAARMRARLLRGA